jgi:hypothetical protein
MIRRIVSGTSITSRITVWRFRNWVKQVSAIVFWTHRDERLQLFQRWMSPNIFSEIPPSVADLGRWARGKQAAGATKGRAHPPAARRPTCSTTPPARERPVWGPGSFGWSVGRHCIPSRLPGDLEPLLSTRRTTWSACPATPTLTTARRGVREARTATPTAESPAVFAHLRRSWVLFAAQRGQRPTATAVFYSGYN